VERNKARPPPLTKIRSNGFQRRTPQLHHKADYAKVKGKRHSKAAEPKRDLLPFAPGNLNPVERKRGGKQKRNDN
jgi:hypothetical protein